MWTSSGVAPGSLPAATSDRKSLILEPPRVSLLRTRENLAAVGAASPDLDEGHASSELLGENDPLPDGDAFAAALDRACLEPDDFSEEAEVVAEDDGDGRVRGRLPVGWRVR